MLYMLMGRPWLKQPFTKIVCATAVIFRGLHKVTDPRPNLLDFSVAELFEVCEKLGEKNYRGRQVAAWIFRHGADNFEQMSNLNKKLRDKLAQNFHIHHPQILEVAQEEQTQKILWELEDKQTVESVLIRERDHLTLCLSSQVGCALGCKFCRTGTMGFHRDLSSGEILGQILGARKLISEDEHISNLVFMGMGEPLLNTDNILKSLAIICDSDLLAMGRKHISLSTVGIIPALSKLAQANLGIGLTISLSACQNELRNQLMPVNHRYPLARLKEALKSWPLPRGRRITIAYVLLKGINDHPRQAAELSHFLTGLRVKINLIPFNPWPGSPFEAPEVGQVESFKEVLVNRNHTVMIRWSKGRGVSAACGQLAGVRKEI